MSRPATKAQLAHRRAIHSEAIAAADGLPPLPEPRVIDKHLPTGYVIRGYTAADMIAYAKSARQPIPEPPSDA